MSRFALLLALAAAVAGAQEWTIGITGFNAKRLTIEPDPGAAFRLRAGSRDIILQHGSTVGLLAAGNEVDIFAQSKTSTARELRITGANGGPAAFSIRDGRQRRRYRGALQVSAFGGMLSAVCRVSDEIAVAMILMTLAPRASESEFQALIATARSHMAASRGRHRGYDFCDRAHCGFQSDPPPLGSAALSAIRASR